jgi:hypothetical protein
LLFKIQKVTMPWLAICFPFVEAVYVFAVLGKAASFKSAYGK